MNKFVYSLNSIVNFFGIGVLLLIGFVVLFEYPTVVFVELSSLTTTAFWLFFTYWCIALILNAQSKQDKKQKEQKENKELVDLLNKK
jgi:predicted tellurium resistance membrane protein TerC